MATAAELQILITAQDSASQQLRQIGTEVARLSQQVSSAGAGIGAGPAATISGVADALRILEGVGRSVGAVMGAIGDQIREGFGSNIELERATVAFERYTGSAQEAAAIIGDLRREAAASPFNDQEVIAAGRALISFAQGSREQLLGLVRVAEQLAVLDPTQGIVGGVRALQEALGGSFTSLFERFEIPLTLIQRWRDEGVSNLEVVKRALDFRGIDAGAIEAYGRSFEGLASTLQSFGQELRQLATAGLFRDVGQALAHLVNLVTQYGDQLRTAAAAVGEVFARMAQSIVQALAPVLGVLDALMPGLREAISAEFSQPIEQVESAARTATPEIKRLQEALSLPGARERLVAAGDDLERLQRLAAQTAQPVAALTRDLAEVQLHTAETNREADRLRAAFDQQLRPLERQRDLLRNNLELQRVQNALASSRSQVERQRLQTELTALERAGAAADPDDPNLTPRQRAIALAAQEHRLRLEELGLVEQQRTAEQGLNQQITEVQRRRAEVLEPYERLLAIDKERADGLQVELQRWGLFKLELDAATAKASTLQKALGGDDATHTTNVQTAQQRGQAVAQAWLDSYQAWVDANGGTAWSAITKSLQKWYDEGGRQEIVRIGTLVAQTLISTITGLLGEFARQTLFPAGMPRVEGQFDPLASVPPVVLAPPGRPGAGGDTQITVNVGDVVAGAPGLADRIRLAVHDAILAVITASAQVAAGPQQPLAGNVR